MKYRILKRQTEKVTEFRAQCSYLGWFWRDTVYVDHGFYRDDMRPKTYNTREQARESIQKHARERIQISEPDTGWQVDSPP